MAIILEDRPSDSPYIERVWRSRSENINTFLSVANYHWDLVVWRQQGQTYINIQGPETQASRAPVPEDAEFFGIVFKSGVYLPLLPTARLVNQAVSLPDATRKSFWLGATVWQLPTYDNAETFVKGLARNGDLLHETAVETVLNGCQAHLSLRSIERRFQHTTGLSHRVIQRIERARRAALLLQQGHSILDTVHEVGYFDQPHLTRSLKYFIGQTPAQLADPARVEQLSLLYKTTYFC